MLRKLKFVKPIVWAHHRHGWKWVISNLTEKLGNPNGTLTLTYVENNAQRGRIHEPWVGFLHTVPITPLRHCFNARPISLEMFFNESHWKRTGERCVGLFTLSEYTKKYIEQFVNIPVKSLVHPTYFSQKVFDFSKFANHAKKLILVGNFLRDYSQIFDIATEYHKFILKGTDCMYEKLSEYFSNKSVSYIERLKDAEYDELLSSNVVFLPLHDCAACNTLVECIARNTPVLITKVGAVSEYLGEDYPLYYSNLEEGAEKIKNLDLVEQAHKYLVNLNKDKLTIDYFVNDLYNSDIYRSL